LLGAASGNQQVCPSCAHCSLKHANNTHSLNLRSNALLSAAQSDNFKTETSVVVDQTNASPNTILSSDVIAVVVITIACLALPLLLVAAWALQDAARPAAQLLAQLRTCIASLVKKRGKSRASSGSRDSTSRLSQSGSKAALLPPNPAASFGSGDGTFWT
jgi:hypothetical protein